MRCLASIFIGVLVFIPVFVFADSNTNLLASINSYRTSKHLSPIKESDTPCTIATIRAIQIMTDFSHAGFYPLVHSSWVTSGHWYENLAVQYTPNYNVLTAWENSPTHNANLLATITYGCIRHVGNYWTFEAWHA